MGTTFGRIIPHEDDADTEVIAIAFRDDYGRIRFLSPFDKMIDMLIDDFVVKSLDKAPRDWLTIKDIKDLMLEQIANDIKLAYFVDHKKGELNEQ